MRHQLILAGFGGQGLMLLGKLICITMMKRDKPVTYVPSYGAEMRGGTANCHVNVSDEFIASAKVEHATAIVVMNQPSWEKFKGAVVPGGLVFVNTSLIKITDPPKNVKIVEVPATETANTLGDVRMANMVMLGALNSVIKFTEFKNFYDNLNYFFTGKKEKFIPNNVKAIEAGESHVKKNYAAMAAK
jgi:2-oxoglutarate ferredoxin oxidoreductase subunit gamma